MSFNVISTMGLMGGGLFIPYDIQELIANEVLSYKYKGKFNDIMTELVSELAINTEDTDGNKKTKGGMILSYFAGYDRKTLSTHLTRFMHAVTWHSTTGLGPGDRIYYMPHMNILSMSYQDLVALRYFIEHDASPSLFTNTWFPSIFNPGIGMINPWGNNYEN